MKAPLHVKMTLATNPPDAQLMRHALTLICGALRSLAPRLEDNDEGAAQEARELAELAADAAGIQLAEEPK